MQRFLLIAFLVLSHLPAHAQEAQQPLTPVAIVALKFTRQGGTLSVSLTNSKLIHTGKNRVDTSSKEWDTEDFVCLLLDQDEHILDTLVVKQPLKPRYEYPTDDGTFGSATIDLTENEVLLRFPYNDRMKFLLVSEVRAQRQLNILTKLPLKLNE